MSQATDDHYAVIGHPVEHSLSPDIHRLFATQCRQSMRYVHLPAPIDAFADTARQFFDQGGAGLNVTLPFKQQAADLATHLTDRAQQAGAVNTLMMTDGKLLGDNTDGCGLVTDLRHRLTFNPDQQHIVILGAGGAVQGVVPSLFAAGAERITIANRTLAKAQSIADHCRHLGAIDACELDDAPAEADLIINAISAALTHQAMPALNPRMLGRASAFYDMVYARQATPFVRWCHQHGLQRGCDGFGMLVEQAAGSFALWRGTRPDTASVIARLRP